MSEKMSYQSKKCVSAMCTKAEYCLKWLNVLLSAKPGIVYCQDSAYTVFTNGTNRIFSYTMAFADSKETK